jgi:hypothetical protein
MALGKGQATMQGAMSGAATGGELGSKLGAIAGPKGKLIGTAVGAVGGALAGGIKANKQAKELEAARNIQAEDPEQRRDLELGRQRLKAYQTGSAADVQSEMQGIQQNTKAGLAAYAKVGGPGTLAGMTQMLKAGQQGINQAAIGGQQQSLQQAQFVRSLSDLMAQRRLEVSMLKRDDAEFDTAEQQNVAGANAMASLGTEGEGALSDLLNKGKGMMGGAQSSPTTGGAGGNFMSGSSGGNFLQTGKGFQSGLNFKPGVLGGAK